MTFSQTLTTLAPALILGFLWVVTKLSPPSREGAESSKSPQWWTRDQETWDTAQNLIGRKYALYAMILTVFCIAMLFLEWEYKSLVGYGLLILFFLLTHYQVRTYMQHKVK